MIELKNVYKRYQEERAALENVNFHLDKGEMVFLTGHSGAGKSTLLKLIAFIEPCSSGDISVGGQVLNQLRAKDIPFFRRQLGLIFQSPNLLDDRSVFDNVSLPLVIQGVPYQEIGRRTRAALELVGLQSKEKLYPNALSGGEQQRIGIARAVVHRPKLLLADEPTGNLDPELSTEIMNIFAKLNHFGVSVVVATHDLALVASMRFRIITLNQGVLM
jgi:cell division transport system ATP-binding protein